MRNVVRLFNDDVGVELCERTGRSPAFQYLQIGCSQKAEQTMLAFARAQVGKPFSMVAMLRSVTWPRKTNGRNYFCAELVAAVLKAGNLMYRFTRLLQPLEYVSHVCIPIIRRSSDSNPASATPKSLYDLYSKQATMTGIPYTMRNIANDRGVERHKPNRQRSESMSAVPERGHTEMHPVPCRSTCSFMSLQPKLEQFRNSAAESRQSHLCTTSATGHRNSYPLHAEVPFFGN